ncbi:OmpA family protein [Loktanella sp. R86503]|uniref:OmpA family protein n=1 Tax=Loktanella sp. R86503 TaxID=3093847 RepID=UPI0036D810BF
MRPISLKSTTSLVLCLSLATPTFAQTADAPFPCVAPDGQTVDGADALARAMVEGAGQADGEAPAGDPAACGPDALAEAVAVGGEALTAPGMEEVPAADDAAAAPVEGDAAGADQAAADQAIDEAAAADKAAQAAEEAAAGEPAPAAQEPVEAEAVTAPDAGDAPAAEAVEESPAAPAAEPAPVTEEAPIAEAAPEAPAVDQEAIDEAADQGAADQAAADAAAAAAAIAAQPAEEPSASPGQPEVEAPAAEEPAPVEAAPEAPATPEAEPEAPAAQEAPAEATQDAEQGVTDGESSIAEDTSAETSTPPAEPALSEEEQAARVAEREAARQNSAAAAAAASGAQPDLVNDPEVVTEEVTEETVRSADEDFDTQVTAATTEPSETVEDQVAGADAGNGNSGGLSNFEKALALGLGAVVVGSILNNGDQVVANSGDRVVVQRDGELRVLKNDDVLLRQPGSQVASRTFDDGSTLTTITREDGSVVTTIRAADGTVLRRSLTRADGTQVQLIDDLDRASVPVEVSSLPPVPQEVTTDQVALNDQAALEAALSASLLAQTGRSYSLEQVREIRQVRALAPQVELAAITFETGSAAIQPSQADELAALGGAIRQIVGQNPSAVFLVEGHTDAVGDAGYNLSLSDRRAETVALALSQYFQVPPENLVTQGYGEQFLKIQTEAGERANRRAAVRNISELLTNG